MTLLGYVIVSALLVALAVLAVWAACVVVAGALDDLMAFIDGRRERRELERRAQEAALHRRPRRDLRTP